MKGIQIIREIIGLEEQDERTVKINNEIMTFMSSCMY